MFRKAVLFGWIILILSGTYLELHAANQDFASERDRQTSNRENRTQEKYQILEENQMDDTDIYAIPYDDSEFEDQQELDLLEGKKFVPETQHNNSQNAKSNEKTTQFSS